MSELDEEGKSKKTIIAYRTVLNQFFEWFGQTTGDVQIDKVTPLDLREYKQYLVVVVQRKPATVNKALVTLKGFFRWAMENGINEYNPAGKIKLVEKQALAPKWLDRNEQNRLVRQFSRREITLIEAGVWLLSN